MTLPTQIVLPKNFEDTENITGYLQDLTTELETMYEDLSSNINGSMRNSDEVDNSKWTPTLQGTNTGTFTYSSQVGNSIRSGIMTEIFFDIQWTSTTSSSSLYVELPYLVAKSNGTPFIGSLQPSSIVFAGSNIIINAIPNTYRGEIWTIGSGLATANLAVPSSGKLTGHLRYIGVENE